MIENKTTSSATMTYWTCGDKTDRQLLTKKLEELGYAKAIPSPRKPMTCLEMAIDSAIAGEKNLLVRPLAKNDGYAIVYEQAATVEADGVYETRARVQIDGTEAISFIPADYKHAAAIRERYASLRSRMPGETVGKVLTTCANRLMAVTMRATGGIYSIPKANIETWKNIGLAVEQSGEGNKVYRVKFDITPDELTALKDGLVREVKSAVSTLQKELENTKKPLGKRAIVSRHAEMAALREKITTYEGIFGESLEEIKEATVSVLASHTATSILSAATTDNTAA